MSFVGQRVLESLPIERRIAAEGILWGVEAYPAGYQLSSLFNRVLAALNDKQSETAAYHTYLQASSLTSFAYPGIRQLRLRNLAREPHLPTIPDVDKS